VVPTYFILKEASSSLWGCIATRSPSLTEVEVQFLPVAEVGIGGDARLGLVA
jgi:hypothetical protein